jgi:hypothetical protein
MVIAAKEPKIKWMSPSPLWGERAAWLRLPMLSLPTRPVVLRFANDMFMDELIAMLTHSPWRFAEWVARPETWRNPMPNPGPIEIIRPVAKFPDSYNKSKHLVRNYMGETRCARIKSQAKTPATLPQLSTAEPIKLYHAIHQRYYVVTASLVVEEKGYPDYLINHGNNERAFFVVRALVEYDEDNIDEYGLVNTSAGKTWRKAGRQTSSAVQRVLPNEERLALFPVSYPDQCDRFRRVLGGLIPVSKQEEWLAAPAYASEADVEIASPVSANASGSDHFREILYSDVIAPWKGLIEQAETEKRTNGIDPKHFPNFAWDGDAALLDKMRNVRTARDGIQTSSWYVLLDLAIFLRDHLPNVWAKLNEEPSTTQLGAPPPTTGQDEARLVEILTTARMSPRLFLELAIENLAVGGFISAPGVTLWERLLAFWKLEIYLKLSVVLHESKSHADMLLSKVAAQPGMLPLFKEQCLLFLDERQEESGLTFLDFARRFGDRYPALRDAAVKGSVLASFTAEGRLRKIAQGIKLPLVQIRVEKAIGAEIAGATEIKESLWDLLSFYWLFETYVDDEVAASTSSAVATYLHSHQQPKIDDLREQVFPGYYRDADSGAWYSFLQFARDLKSTCPLLYAVAISEIFSKNVTVDGLTNELAAMLKKTEITNKIHEKLYYPNPDQRNIKIIPSLVEALPEILKWSDRLEEVDTPYDRSIQADADLSKIDERWPDFLFPLTDPEPLLTLEQSHIVPGRNPGNTENVESLHSFLDELADLIDSLVRTEKESLGVGKSATLRLEPLLKKDPRFVIRFVFDRPQCGALFHPLVSQPTCQLAMAPLFDFDAPARPVRIRMPLDISPAGLRKYQKNAVLLFSDLMCGKIKKIKKLTLADLVLSVLPWPFHKDLPKIGDTGPCRSKGETLGMFCSLSIPIVTLCAMILLFIMVSLFNIFFKWIPWFFMCFPLPGLKGKDSK